jgi:dihydroflavonol-4-reductase
MTAAVFDTLASRLTGRAPRIPLEGVRMSRYRMFFDSSKAVCDLAIPQSPIEEALARAVSYFREAGHARA